ncbi:MAG TPA: glycoside hydrolase family 2, partial [Solibacterales bacterium]|nr:glycoside hydrolase family 2 [Bryobacterales bacterium]
YLARVWVNGRFAGEHTGGHVGFKFDITPHLAAGANTIVVRAEDFPTDRYLPRGKQYWEPQSRGIFYTRTTGIWQPVWLEAAGESYLETVRITPSNDGPVTFEGYVERPGADLELHAIIKWGGTVVASGMSRADNRRASVAAFVREPRLWSVQAPNLYDVTFEVRRGAAVLDRVQSYFGFRSITVRNNRVNINNRPVYLKMILDQGYWPDSVLTPPSDEAIQLDIRLTKEMGFNGARKHQKIEDPRFLYWADKMGLLVSSEMANAYLFDDRYLERFTREWVEAVQRDYNHPSIIMWVPINESWGTPRTRDARQAEHLRANYLLTRSLDPTRLVIDNDGWEHTDMTDLFAIHDYSPMGPDLVRRYGDMGKPGYKFPEIGPGTFVPGYSYNGTPVYLSEFGGIAYIAPGTDVPKDAWGYAGVMKDEPSATARLASLYDAIANLGFAGICYTQLTDVEQEINGLLTFDRKPKFDVKKVKEMNDKLR